MGPIHSEKCRLFQPTYKKDFIAGVQPPNLSQAAPKSAASETPATRFSARIPTWRPPAAQTSTPNTQPVNCVLPLKCASHWARTQVLSIMHAIDKLPKDRSDLHKLEWRRHLLLYHPDKRNNSSNMFAGRSDSELNEVFQEIKKRYDQHRS